MILLRLVGGGLGQAEEMRKKWTLTVNMAEDFLGKSRICGAEDLKL